MIIILGQWQQEGWLCLHALLCAVTRAAYLKATVSLVWEEKATRLHLSTHSNLYYLAISCSRDPPKSSSYECIITPLPSV